jgi:hypothetical protein
MSSTGDPSVRPAHGEATPAVPLWLQARLDELVDQATTARAAVATGGAWRESLAALAAIEDLADGLQHAVVDELRVHAPKAWSWSAIGRALGVTPQAAHTRFAERARARRRKRPATSQEPVAAATSTPPPAPVLPAPAAIAPQPGAPPATERHQDMLTAAEVPAASTMPTDTTTPASRPPAPARPRRRGAAKDAAYELVKAGDHSDSHRWDVLADGERIGWVQPAYGAVGRRKGWSGVMANLTPAALSGQAAVHPTRQAAAAQVIESWQQQTRSRGALRRRQLEHEQGDVATGGGGVK